MGGGGGVPRGLRQNCHHFEAASFRARKWRAIIFPLCRYLSLRKYKQVIFKHIALSIYSN